MASLFKKSNSPFWYLRYKKNGNWLKQSTGLRHDDPNDTAKARILRAEAEAKEYHQSPTLAVGWDWVSKYLRDSGLLPRSIERYIGSWHWLNLWLTEKRIDVPQIRYAHAQEYIDWRVGRRKQSGKAAGRNTAIGEVKLLSSLLIEAVRRSMIVANPLQGLNIRKSPQKKKPEFSDEEIEKCRAALKIEPLWMQRSFEIALCTGCRLRETRIPMSCVDLDAEVPTITFPNPKGGESKAFSIPCPTALLPLMKELRSK